ncbi:phosphatase PAP2 family protein [Zafaria sp. Z1313]|uniref:phosphatase PAP2 family protein n=1 Tax=unclassified Zafaria TaxID=2828765 RepID=UPI002E7A3819|nr:phosphatase PAP2 family protein [Zafaria sp. J156]MEE1622688.1 phosphatase PAP2 family protein [Zafaria sp. J156]
MTQPAHQADPGDKAASVVARVAGPYGALWLVLVLGAAAVTALTALAAEIYESVVEADGLAGVDQPLLDWMITLRSPGLDAGVTAFTDVGGTVGMPVVALAAIGVLTWMGRSWRPLILVAATAAGSLLMTVVGKELIGRARPALADAVPPYESSASFPSGHTLNATAIVAVIVYLCWIELRSRTARIVVLTLGLLFVVGIGSSRVFLGHHWFTDVVAAWALGLAWAAVVVLAHRAFHTVRRVRRQSL